MAKPSISTSLGPKKKRRFGQALAGPHTSSTFQEVYDRPGQLKQATAAGRPAPPGGDLSAARTGRKNLAQALLTQPGARKGLRQAYGKGYEQGDLAQALSTVKEAKRSTASGAAPGAMGDPRVKKAQRQADKYLAKRRKFLLGRYMA